MRFLMLVTLDPSRAGGQDEGGGEGDAAGTLEVEDWIAKHDATGVRRLGSAVATASDSTGVCRRGGQVLVTDGPYAESQEWIVGFDVLECADLDEAISVAAEHPMAVGGRLELRRFLADGNS